MATSYYNDDQVTLWHGAAIDVLRTMPDQAADCIITSPPYWGMRDYEEPGQYGLEEKPTDYVQNIASVFAEAYRVLADHGTLWLNLGDTYAGKGNAGASVGRTRRADRAELIPRRINSTAEAPYKSLLMLPERIALSMIDDGWCLRNRIVWHKPNGMPESVTDRFSNRHEALFLFVKSSRYWFDLDVLREPDGGGDRGKTWTERRAAGAPGRHGLAGAAAHGDSDFAPHHNGTNPGDVWRGEAKYVGPVGPLPAQTNCVATGTRHNRTHEEGRNPGDVWTVSLQPFPGAHFAVMPPRLAERCVLAGCKPGGVVLDPFAGSCTTGMVALRHGRRFLGIDLSAKYLAVALRTRLAQGALIDDAGVA